MFGQNENEVPSRASIGWALAFTVLVFAADLYVALGDDGAHGTVGWALGFLAFYLMAGRTADRAARRRGLIREARVAAFERELERRDQTGTWTGPENQPGMVLTVRWDPHLCVFLVKGWVSDNYQVPEEIRWWGDNWGTLRRMIEEAEVDGLEPADDEPTRAIRARLNVKGWDDPAPSDRPTGVQGGDWLNQELGIHPRGRS